MKRLCSIDSRWRPRNGPASGGRSPDQSVDVKLEPDDRRAPEEVALARSQAVEPHREEPPERGRDSFEGPLVERDEQLFGEQRVPL
jgi:hypothetical protein